MSAASVNKTSLHSLMPVSNGPELQSWLKNFARELAAELAAADPEHCEELFSTLISELAMSAADQRRLRERRLKQAQGIAAAKAKGVHFGRPAPPLPENFDNCHRAWRNGEMTLLQAANACGMRKTTFENAAIRREQFPECPA